MPPEITLFAPPLDDASLSDIREHLRRWFEAMPPLDSASLLALGTFVAGDFDHAADPAAYTDRVLNEGFIAPGRDELPPWPLSFPIDWAADPYADANWHSNLNQWRHLEIMLVQEQRTADAPILDHAVRTVLDWHEFNVVQGRPNARAWGDRATGIRTVMLIYLLWRLHTSGTPPRSDAELHGLLTSLAAHIEKLLVEGFISTGNHGLPQVHALAAALRLLPALHGTDRVEAALMTAWRRILDAQFNEEGVHLEHSPQYHRHTAELLGMYLQTGIHDDVPGLHRLARKAKLNTKWMHHPDGSIVRIGDTSDNSNFDRRLSPRSEPVAPPLLKAFPKTGYCIIRSRWETPADQASMLFFSGAFHSGRHRHADDLTFEWFDRGRHLLTDPGRFAANRQHAERSYVQSTRAHNTVEIDGRSYHKSRRRYGSAFREAWRTPLGVAIHARATHAFHEEEALVPVRRDRLLVFEPGRWLLVIDRLVSAVEHNYVQWFQLAPDLGVTFGDRGGVITEPDGATVGRIVPPEGQSFGLPQALRGVSGERPQGWMSVGYRKIVPATSVGIPLRAASGLMATLFLLCPDDALDAGRPRILVRSNARVTVRIPAAALAADITFRQQPVIRMR